MKIYFIIFYLILFIYSCLPAFKYEHYDTYVDTGTDSVTDIGTDITPDGEFYSGTEG